MHAHLRKIRISPKKVNLVAGMVRNKSVKEALSILEFTNKSAAKPLYKVIHSAMSNAEHNFKQNPDALVIKEIIVNDGPIYKRFQPVSRGRAHPILKRTSHITVKIEASAELIKSKPGKKKTATKAAAPTTDTDTHDEPHVSTGEAQHHPEKNATAKKTTSKSKK